MTKETGLGDHLSISGYDLSGDIGSIKRIGGGLKGTQNVTGIDKRAYERKGLLRDGGFDFTSFFNTDPGAATTRLKTLPTSDVVGTYHHGAAIGNPAASAIAKQIDYNPNRGVDGSLTVDTSLEANGFGLEWGEQLTAWQRTDVAGTNGASLDAGASSANGLQAYLHVYAFVGTNVTIKIQESSDNGAGDPFADVVGGDFTLVTGITSQRIATSNALSVERYLRVVTSGTFSSVTFSVMCVRNKFAVVF